MKTKKCAKCRQRKSVELFSKGHNKTGLHCYCKKCANNNAKKWYKNNKNDINTHSRLNDYSKNKTVEIRLSIDKLKSSIGCLYCNEKEACCLDFHHLDRNEKDRNVSAWALAKSITKVINEIKKCICVCANCHRKIHFDKIVCDSEPISEDIINEYIHKDLSKKYRYKYIDKPISKRYSVCPQCGMQCRTGSMMCKKCRIEYNKNRKNNPS